MRSFYEADSDTEIIQRLIENFIYKITEEISGLKKSQEVIDRNQKRIMEYIGVSELSEEEGEEEMEEGEQSSESSGEDERDKIKPGDPSKLHSEIRELSDEDRKSSVRRSQLQKHSSSKGENSSIEQSLKIPSQGPADSSDEN